ncbi:MAG: hypothetical protein HPY59_07230 [Anaerolineae bacterium]|nr:hypothetical protein [Anaerolineae bacterium]
MPKWLWFSITALVLTVLVMLPILPVIQQTPEKNSGMFLYTAQQMVEGKKLYKEVWDHKPPLIFAINSLGLILGKGSLWGIWGIQFLFCFLVVFLILVTLNRFFSAFTAAFSVVCAMAALMMVNHGGNYSENYGLLFQAGVFWLALHAGKTYRKTGRLYLAAGVLAGLAFMLKQNLIGFGLALGIYLILREIFRKTPHQWQDVLGLVSGFGLTMLLFFGYFYLRGVFVDFWDAAFRYNLAYTRLGLLERINASLDVVEMLSTIPPFTLAMAAWLSALLLICWQFSSAAAGLLRRRNLPVVMIAVGIAWFLSALLVERVTTSGAAGFGLLQWLSAIGGLLLAVAGATEGRLRWMGHLAGWLESLNPPLKPEVIPLVGVAVLWFPIDILMVSLSGRTYVYYLIALVPVTAFLLGILAHILVDQAGQRSSPMRLVASSLMVIVMAAPMISFFNSLKPGSDHQIDASVQAILDHSNPGDTVLTWGSQPLINFLTDRPQPSRYIHSWFFFTDHYALVQRQAELLESLIKKKPTLILDTKDPDAPFVEDMQNCLYPSGSPPGILGQVFDYICRSYILIDTVGPEKWPLYQYEG